MCGLCGILTFDELARQPEFAQAVAAMAGLMVRPGPDDARFWSTRTGASIWDSAAEVQDAAYDLAFTLEAGALLADENPYLLPRLAPNLPSIY